jgi:hypothetical protein
MNRIITTRVKMRQYQDMLLSDIGPEERSRVHKQLIEEEDKLGSDLKLLADIEWHIAEGALLIEAQQSRVSAMQANGHDGLARAQGFLDGMIESQRISMQYRQLVKEEIERNRLLDREQIHVSCYPMSN